MVDGDCVVCNDHAEQSRGVFPTAPIFPDCNIGGMETDRMLAEVGNLFLHTSSGKHVEWESKDSETVRRSTVPLSEQSWVGVWDYA